MPQPLRILVLSYETPAFPAGGGPARQHALLSCLARRHTTRVVSTGGEPLLGRPPQGVELRLVEPAGAEAAVPPSWLARNAGHYLGGRPWVHVAAAHHARALAAVLPQELRTFAPDVVVVEHGELGALLRAVGERPRLLVLHNILASVQRQKIAQADGLWARGKELGDLAIAAAWERADIRRATRVITTTEHDAALARRLGGRRVAVDVVPNCVDAAHWARPAGAVRDPALLVMTASFHYPPNQAAAAELVEHVLPAVRARVPEATLRLVGQGMPDDLAARLRAAEGVEVTGAVDDVRPHLWAASLALAPLRLGSGSPIKVLEALSAGAPVVSTQRVAQALGLAVGEGVVAAGTPQDIAAQVASLLDDPARAAQIAERGRAAVVARYDREVAAAALERSLCAAAGGRR